MPMRADDASICTLGMRAIRLNAFLIFYHADCARPAAVMVNAGYMHRVWLTSTRIRFCSIFVYLMGSLLKMYETKQINQASREIFYISIIFI